MKLSELQAKHAANLTELGGMIDARDAAGVEFTTEQKAKFDALEAATQVLNDDITRATKEENIRIQTARNKVDQPKPEEKAAKAFSFTRAIAGAASGRLSGLELEMSQEAQKELREAGISDTIKGAGVPSWALKIKGTNVMGQTRDLTAGGASTGAEYIQTLEIKHQYGLEIAPSAFGLGVEVLTGLTNNVYVTQTGSATAVWATENAGSTETTPATSKPVNLSPTRMTAFTDISGTLLAQTGGAAEERVKFQIQRAVNRKLDATIFNGSGSGEPYGILNLSGANSVAIGTDGGTPSREKLIEMWTKIAEDNAELDTLAYVTTPGVKGYLWGATIDAGSGRFNWENDMLLGYKALASNHIPSNLTKGASVSNCHAIILGVFNQFVVGQWGGMDLMINPFTRSKEDIIEVLVNSHWAMGAYYPEAFCHIKDAKTA